jgi:hypothetical protein
LHGSLAVFGKHADHFSKWAELTSRDELLGFHLSLALGGELV